MKVHMKALVVVIAIVLLALGWYAFAPGLIAQDCKSELSCIRAAFDNCSIAKYSRDVPIEQQEQLGGWKKIGQFTEYAEIQGPWIGGCRLFVKWADAEGSLASWKNAEMNCIVDTKNYDLTYDGLKKACTGRLIEAYNTNNMALWPLNTAGLLLPLS